MRVLIADDSALIRERIQEMLSIYRQLEIIGSYKNGNETLEALRILKPDLAIVDYKMPGLSGIQVLSEIRKEDKILKFIILTFHSTEFYRNLAMETGADYFFSKSDEFEQLSTLIEELLNIEHRSKKHN